jgi:signal transduction histidine kinase/CheY-like chemotaxis protein
VVTTVALATASVVNYYYLNNLFLERVQTNQITQAGIIADNNTAALSFNDTIAAAAILNTLSNDSAVLQVALYNSRYQYFSGYSRKKEDVPDMTIVKMLKEGEPIIDGNALHVIAEVSDEQSEGEIIGYLYLKRGMSDIDMMMRRFVVHALIIIFSVLILAVILAILLQRIVSRPILRISQLTRSITQSHNYKVQLPYTASDETGELVKNFNEMLVTIDTQNESLVAAREEALKNAKVKEEFLANMSHEIRTPLNVIVGLSNILIDTGINEEQKKYLTSIKASSDNVLLIVNDILDYSRISSGKIEFDRNPFSVIDVANEVIESLKVKSAEKSLEMKFFTGPGIPEKVTGDRLKLYQILLNLVTNSLKFTNQGYIHLFIELEGITESTCSLKFKVRDTGIGIPPDKHQLIFESFRQASADTTVKYGGTGLGLAISKQLVELQGGKIWLDSIPGQGSTFTFNIIYNRTDSALSDTTVAAMPPDISLMLLKKARVLVIEDNLMNMMVVQALLKKGGVSFIHTASNADEAKQNLIQFTYHVILMDINMPDTSGFELTRFIREELAGIKRNTPVIAITGAVSAEERDAYIKAGMNDFIPKPFNPRDLFTKISKYINPES